MYETIKPIPFSEATGAVACNMTNDALFHIVLQENNEALTGLIASLLHIDPESIGDAEVQNPIKFGHLLLDKAFVLDILVSFRDGSSMNLEMQVKDLKNWIPRSLSYLCREFNQLKHGDDYDQIKAVYHVGFLDYTLFPDQPEFYATYRMRNIKTGHEYSDKFTLSVVQLNHINMATEEDKAYDIDKWAALFKATTWEEVRMLAETNPYIASAAESIYSSVTDPDILELCKKRQEEIDGDIHRRERLAEQERLLAEQEEKLAEKEKKLTEQEEKLTEQEEKLAQQDKKITEQDMKITEQDKKIEEQDQQIADLTARLEDIRRRLSEK